jgi:heat shock protein HtpX
VAAARNIYEQQAYNKRMTAVIVAIFIAVFALLGFAIDSLLLGIPNDEVPLPIATLVTICFATTSAIWAFQSGWKVVLKSSGARRVNPKDPAHRQLLNVVEEMKIAAGIPMPGVFIIHDCDFNALSTGRDPQHSAVAVTDSLLIAVSREELQGVIAHEMSHIRNYDIRLMTILTSLIGAFVLLVETVLRTLKEATRPPTEEERREWSSDRLHERDDAFMARLIFAPLYFLVWLVAAVITPMILRLMATAVSRSREYLADATAAELTRNPAGLASALKKIGSDRIPTVSIKAATAHMCIIDPMGSGFNDQEGFLAELFGTHPPLLKRIKKLDAMAYRINPQVPDVPQVPH